MSNVNKGEGNPEDLVSKGQKLPADSTSMTVDSQVPAPTAKPTDFKDLESGEDFRTTTPPVKVPGKASS